MENMFQAMTLGMQGGGNKVKIGRASVDMNNDQDDDVDLSVSEETGI